MWRVDFFMSDNFCAKLLHVLFYKMILYINGCPLLVLFMLFHAFGFSLTWLTPKMLILINTQNVNNDLETPWRINLILRMG